VKLDHLRVRDCMHAGILSCAPETPLCEVARLMGDHRVHAIAVADIDNGRPSGIVSDMDVMAAAAAGQEPVARDAAATEAATISADERLDLAAQMMCEHAVAHLVVLDPAGGYPVGILSTLDVASAYGGPVA
jgi:CBS domain-containing protein